MAAALSRNFACVRKVFVRFCHYGTRNNRHRAKIYFGVGSGISLYAAVGVTMDTKVEKLRFPDPLTLTHSALIRNACGLSIDSATALLSQSTAALMQLQQQYIETMEHLIELLEMHGRLQADNPTNDQLWDSIVATRAKLLQYRKDKEELEMIFHGAEKTLASAAETAFLAGAEAYSIMASERIQSAHQHLQPLQAKLGNISEELINVEANLIKSVKKHQDKESETGTEDDGVDFEKLLEKEMKNLDEHKETYDIGREESES